MLLLHNEIKGSSNANCIEDDSISILTVSSGKKRKLQEYKSQVYLRIYDDDSHNESHTDQINNQKNKNIEFDTGLLSEYRLDVIAHIAGCVLKSLYKVISCEACIITALEVDYFV